MMAMEEKIRIKLKNISFYFNLLFIIIYYHLLLSFKKKIMIENDYEEKKSY